MKIPKMMVLVETNAVRETEAVCSADGWIVWIAYRHRDSERCEMLERQRGGVRTFATLDAVARCLNEVGLSGFRVRFPDTEAP